MREAKLNGKVIIAETNAPDIAVCPDYGTDVVKGRRTCMDGVVTYFCRHKRGQGEDSPGDTDRLDGLDVDDRVAV